MTPSTKQITLEILQEFCCKLAQPEAIRNPYFNRGRIVATDSRILILADPTSLTPIDAEMKADGPDIDPAIFSLNHADLPQSTWVDVPKVDVPKNTCGKCHGSGKCRMCRRCEGSGSIECVCSECENAHTTRCPDCDGAGQSNKMPEVTCPACDGSGEYIDFIHAGTKVGAMRLSSIYLYKIRQFLPNAMIERRMKGDTKPVRFIFDGGIGLLMPMRIR